jgi:ABC-type multidrug transport system permease subunit
MKRNEVYAIYASLRSQWKASATSAVNLHFLIGGVPMAAVVAWIASQSDNPSVLTYLLVGAPLLAIWNLVMWSIGWSLSRELWGRTLEFVMTSRTPMILVLFGKSLAYVVYGIPTALVALLIMFLIVRELPHVANFPMLLVSLLFVIVGMVAIGLLLTPLNLLFRGRAGFFNAILPFGSMLSGFLFPIDQLPHILEIIARLLPTSWAMLGVWQSIRGPDSLWSVAGTWAASFLASALLLSITYLLFKVVEKRMRITGVLSTY